jgi:hypothetical protein
LRHPPPIELIQTAAAKLGDLCPEVVFLGGAVLGLLITEEGAPPPRTTRDVDVAIELVPGYLELFELDQRLLRLGFRNDMAGPTCRYLHGPTILDVIPVQMDAPPEVNLWYPLAIKTARIHHLKGGETIRVISPVCFLASKLAAFRSATRENSDDMFLSRDFEDIVRLVDGCPEIVEDAGEAPPDLKKYLRDQVTSILQVRYSEEGIMEHFERGREAIVLDRFRALIRSTE